MTIQDYILSITKQEIAVFYELKCRHEERKAFTTIILIVFAVVIILPLIFAQIVIDALALMPAEQTGVLSTLVIQSLIIVLLTLSLTNNAYRCGKLFRTLRDHKDLDSMLLYINNLDEDNACTHIAYIMRFKQYLRAYMSGDELIIEYKDDDMTLRRYSTSDFEQTCDDDCPNATLVITIDQIIVMNRTETEGQS